MGMSDFDFSLLEVMDKNFLIDVTFKNEFKNMGQLRQFMVSLIFEVKVPPLRFWLTNKTYRKQAIHLNSMLIVKLVLDVHNIFQSK